MKFHKKLIKQATDVLDPIKMAATWTASITAAAGTSLTQSLFVKLFKFHKSLTKLQGTLIRFVTLTRIAKNS